MRIEAGYDWITATIPKEAANAPEMERAAYALLREAVREGYNVYESHELRAVGQRSENGIFVGESATHLTIVCSSALSNEMHRRIWPYSPNITRIDLQVTVWPESDADTYILDAYQQSIAFYNGSKKQELLPRLMTSAKPGATVYVGERKNKTMLRLYNKGAETPGDEYKGAMRYEVEIKDRRATQTVAMIEMAGVHRLRRLSQYVYKHYEARGITPIWPIDTTDYEPVKMVYEESNTAKQLRWLERQVAPVCRKMSEQGLREYVTMLLFGDVVPDKEVNEL